MLSQSRINASLRAAFNHGEKQGMAQGMAQGRNDRSEEIARKMQEMGLSPEQIKQATGVDL